MSKIRLGYLFLIASFVSFSTLAEKTALVGGRLIDGFGNQPIANSVILIENGIIQQVGTIESLDVPSSFKNNFN